MTCARSPDTRKRQERGLARLERLRGTSLVDVLRTGSLDSISAASGNRVRRELERPGERPKHPYRPRPLVLSQRRKGGDGKRNARKRRLPLLQVALESPHRDPRQPLRLLLGDRDRQLERLGQVDAAELARHAFRDDEVAGFRVLEQRLCAAGLGRSTCLLSGAERLA